MGCLAGVLAGFGVVGCGRGGLWCAVGFGGWFGGCGGAAGCLGGLGFLGGGGLLLGSAVVCCGEQGFGAGVLFGQSQKGLSGGVAHEGGEVP